jgi:glycosyltransferase involved in cell wall biosynthesis
MISVVTVTYNNFSELQKTVESLAPVRDRIEHIIVNGGQCEQTKAYLRHYRCKSISEPDRGISDAFNKGVRMATGSGVVFLNSGDVLIRPEYLEWAESQLTSKDFTFSDILFDDAVGGVVRLKPHRRSLGKGMPFPHPSLVVKRQVFDSLGGFVEQFRIAMDYEFVCRMQNAKLEGVYYGQPVALMDGTGVSAKNEGRSLIECKNALIANNLWSFGNRFAFYERRFLYSLRTALLTAGLGSLVGALRRVRYNMSYQSPLATRSGIGRSTRSDPSPGSVSGARRGS